MNSLPCTSAGSPDYRRGETDIGLASLGVPLVWDKSRGGFRVERIYEGDPTYPEQVSPLRKPGVQVEEGDVIFAINGIPHGENERPGDLLRAQAGRQDRLQVQPSSAGESRDVIVVPITGWEFRNLRYDDWEESRRQLIEEWGDGKVAYLHLSGMSGRNFAEFIRGYYPVFQPQRLIIDVRNNTGGNIDSWIITRLLRQARVCFQAPYGETAYWNQQYAFRGHLAVIVNEKPASDGETFAEGVKRLELGRVVGTSTSGGGIRLRSSNRLVDNGIARAPEFGVFGPEGEWMIEEVGVEPTHFVRNLPHSTFRGEDAQLRKAQDLLLRKIEEDPRRYPADLRILTNPSITVEASFPAFSRCGRVKTVKRILTKRIQLRLLRAFPHII